MGYGYGLDEGEHYGEVHLAGLVRVLPSLHVGLDARARLDEYLRRRGAANSGTRCGS